MNEVERLQPDDKAGLWELGWKRGVMQEVPRVLSVIA